MRARSPTVYFHKPSCRPTTLPASLTMSPGDGGRYESATPRVNEQRESPQLQRRTEKAAEAFPDADEADAHTVLLFACVHAPLLGEISDGVLRGKVAEREERSFESADGRGRQVMRLVFTDVGAAVECWA